MFTAQVILLILFVLGFFLKLKQDINGKPASAPTGYGGVVVTIVVYCLVGWANVTAGTFSLLVG